MNEVHVHCCNGHQCDKVVEILGEIRDQLARIATSLEALAGAEIKPLIDKLKASSDALKAATEANQPKP